MHLFELTRYLDSYLKIADIKDYGPQGLQIEGRSTIRKIVGAVDSHQPVVDAALASGADLLLVHHGIFWGREQMLNGHFGRLVKSFMKHDLNLYAAHLVLDAHPEVGNNAQLAKILGFKVVEWFAKAQGTAVGVIAEVDSPIDFDEFAARYQTRVGPINLAQKMENGQCRRIGIVSGLGASYIEEAKALGCDTFLTGETSHVHYYSALNTGLNALYGGHYASETVCIKALGAHLVDKFGIEFEFIDLPTGL